MNKILLILILTLSFQTLVKADDIRDFELEGISVGGSLLNLVSKSEIIKNKDFKHPNKKYFSYLYSDKKDSKYDYFQFSIMDRDKSYKIEDVSAGIYFKNNIKDCLKKMDEVITDVSYSFPNLNKSKKNERKHRGDPSGKSTITEVYFHFKTGDVIAIQCIDFSKELNYIDQLSIEMASAKYYDWLANEAFK
tara:strand:+ start:169 stop:744 length:576 start_codon:yes stop_codon:yes gene_type:complete